MAYYYGWTDEYLENMDVQVFHNYYIATRVIERQNQINNISASLSSMQKQNDVNKKIEKLQRSIKDCFEQQISSVNAKYLAEQELQNGN